MDIHSPIDIDNFNKISKQFIADVKKPDYIDFIKVLTYLSSNSANEHQILFLIDTNTFSNEKYTKKVLAKLLEKRLVKTFTLSPLVEDESIRTGYRITSKGKFYLIIKWNEILHFISKNKKQIIISSFICLIVILFFSFIEEIKAMFPSETQFYWFLDRIEARSGTISIPFVIIGVWIAYLAYKKSNKNEN